MNIQKQFEACAKLDGLTVVRSRDTDVVIFYRGSGETLVEVNPNYDTDNEIDRLVRGLDEDTDGIKYTNELWRMLDKTAPSTNLLYLLRATTAQKREALLRATGKFISNECEKEGE